MDSSTEMLYHLRINYFLNNMCCKHYENQTMLSQVTAKNVPHILSLSQHGGYVRVKTPRQTFNYKDYVILHSYTEYEDCI